MKEYVYRGRVMEFDRCVDNAWTGKTYAQSEKKARTNLTFQFKKQTGRAPRSKISLPDTLSEVKKREVFA